MITDLRLENNIIIENITILISCFSNNLSLISINWYTNTKLNRFLFDSLTENCKYLISVLLNFNTKKSDKFQWSL